MSEKVEGLPADVVAGNFQFNAQLPNGKGMSVSCYVFKDEDEASLNARMDLVARVIERQRRIAEIPELEAKLKQTEDARDQVIRIAEELSGRDKLNQNQKQALQQHSTNLRLLEQKIAEGKLAVLEAKKLLPVEA